MDLGLYLAFFVATTVMIVLPGPSVMLAVAHSMIFGWRRAFVTVTGITCGIAVQLAITLIGMASFLLLLAEWFEWLRWAGVAYLLYLGIRLWRAPAESSEGEPGRGNGRSLFLQGLVVTIPNPKSLLFLAAFFPQFVDPTGSTALQLSIMAPTFLAIAFVFTSLWAIAAGRARHLFQSRKRILLRNRITGGLMICAGLGLALARRA